jgi:choline-sulfatase
MTQMNRREFGKRAGLALGAGLTVSSTSGGIFNAMQERQSRPNIVFISSDNQSYKDVGYAGHPVVKTPNIDRIARNGVIFSNAYCGSPVCAPGRAGMMTGMYPSDSNSFCNATPWDGSQPIWAARLKETGYYSRSIGKLDLNGNFDTGFEEFESKHGHVEKPDITALFRRPLGYRIGERLNVNGAPRETRHEDGTWTRMATDFLRQESRNSERPWTLNVGLHQPHVAFFEREGFLALRQYWDMYPIDNIPMPNVPDGHLENQHLVFQELRRFKRLATPLPDDRIRRARAGYYGMISELDEYVGQIWTTLEETGQIDNTLFVFTSDNGMSMGEHGLFFHNSLYEEAAHVPLIMAGAGIPGGKTVQTPVAHVDVVATMLEMAGVDIPSNFRGHSLTPLIEGRQEKHPGYAYSESHSEGNCTGSFMIRKGDWKYIHFTWYDDLLFNLADDPGEFNNLVNDSAAQNIRMEVQSILNAQVDTEAVTMRAFKHQEQILENLVNSKTEDELYELFEFRLGPGQARALASRCKGR